MIWQDVGLLFDTSIWMKHTSSGDIKVLSLKAMIRELLVLCPRESVILNYPGIHALSKSMFQPPVDAFSYCYFHETRHQNAKKLHIIGPSTVSEAAVF